MLLSPKKVKFRKWQKGRSNPDKPGVSTRGAIVSFGDFGMQSTSRNRITSNQIEATRRVIVKSIGKDARMWVRIFPDRPYTKKANEVGMGKGKGDPQGFEVQILPGRILFEVSGVSEEIAKKAVSKGGKKLPLKVRLIKRI